MVLGDTLTTRESLRRAVLDDIISRCDIAAVEQEGGPLDGLKVVSMGILRDQVSAHLMVRLDPPPDKYAEVTTPAQIAVSAICPTCDIPQVIGVHLTPQLVVDDDGSELKVKASTKGSTHVCGQLPLDGIEGQIGIDEVVPIDNLRRRILRAVADSSDAWGNEIDPGPPPTVDTIAARLEIPTEAERSDLEDSLYHLADPEVGLVELVPYDKKTKVPTHYVLTDAGIAWLAEPVADPPALVNETVIDVDDGDEAPD